MSHVTGTVQILGPPLTIVPGTTSFNPLPAPGGTKLLILHFQNVNFQPGDQLQVNLGYDVDTFTVADGSSFWTRPVNVYALPSGVPITYVAAGAATGSVQLDRYGRGERHTKDPANTSALFDSLSNCDPFLGTPSYLEPDYAKFWFCNDPPHWENVASITPSGDIRNTVTPSVGIIMGVDFSKELGFHLSTCSVTLVSPDTIITAGHCMQNPIEDAKSSSVIFGYQTDSFGNKPGGYSPQVVKVKEVIRQRYADGTSSDYCLLRLATPVLGITPRPMRIDIPTPGEQVFGIHHPNGAVKKLSIPHPGFATVGSSDPGSIQVNLDVS